MKYIIAFCLVTFCSLSSFAQTAPTEIIYAHKDGMALSMLQQQPTGKSNGRAIVSVVSGNWTSNYDAALRRIPMAERYAAKGYTVFTVMHGSQPRYNIADEVKDIKKAVQYIRYNAGTLHIDADHIGIIGQSSGGHLALLVATTPSDGGDSTATDPAYRVSDRVQAAGVLFPPTDFLNYGSLGAGPAQNPDMLKLLGIAAAFDFKKWDAKKQVWIYATPEERLELAKTYSPVYSVTADDAPALLVHGDKDMLVPLQQSQTMVAAYEKAKVPAKLVIKSGAGHGWRDTSEEDALIIAWFDKYL